MSELLVILAIALWSDPEIDQVSNRCDRTSRARRNWSEHFPM